MDDPDYILLPFPPLEPNPPQPTATRRATGRLISPPSSPRNRVAQECLRVLRIERWGQFGQRVLKLDMFPSLCIDIVLEVLAHLHPLDLIHLSRTTREFRQLLHEPGMDRIWRGAFVSPLPKCPSEMLGRRWANRLFGSAKCEMRFPTTWDTPSGHLFKACGRSETPLDYTIWRRICHQLIRLGNLHPPELSKLIAGTRRSGYGPRVLRRDVRIIIDEYNLLKAAEGPAAVLALAAFVERRISLVQETQKIAVQYAQWDNQVVVQYQAHDARNLKAVRISVEKRLLEEGYDLRDLKDRFLSEVPPLCGIGRLSSKRWNKVRPYIIPKVRYQMWTRLREERCARVSVAAARITEILYTHVAPATWTYTPTAERIALDFPQFKQITEDAENVVLARDDPRLVAALAPLPANLVVHYNEQRAALAASIPGVREPPDLRALELATTIFSCGATHCAKEHQFCRPQCCLVGWRDAGARQNGERECNYKFSYRASTTAGELVRLVGLDPKTTTAEDMDSLDRLFVCDDCLSIQRGREVMRWRVCLQHSLKHAESDPGRHILSWTVLSPLGAADVRRREGPLDPAHWDADWLCTLCPAHFHHQAYRVTAIAHVASQHAIANPSEGVHFIHRVGAHWSPRLPVFLSCAPHAAEYRCKQCAEELPYTVKLLTLRAVNAHVLGKHMVDPSETGWTKVDRLLAREGPRGVSQAACCVALPI
ncbi:hypothetical protein C8R47DRAFT_1223489 [Mycena vitilis]|nr:hypothetical protein C8R47DRAFT_1223489 [Mycena vitilis]